MTAPGPSPEDFDFELPAASIAGRPATPRDSARLLDLRGPADADRCIADLPGLLRPGDLLLCNDTRVIPARLRGRRGDARVEVTLHREEAPGRWRAFARPARKLAPGADIAFAPDFAAEVIERLDGGEIRLRFDRAGPDLARALERHGEMPLPPYIRRAAGADARDRVDYQTLFAARDGAVAAPTAGLHFTPALVDALAAREIRLARVTLHVGAGTFLPVRVDDLQDHRMHAEWGEIGKDTADLIAATRAAGGRLVCIGTTTLRVLETAAAEDGTVAPWQGETTLFILPGYRFKAADLLLTNFHLPRSTLFMLVCAFAGTARMKAAYARAVATGYRFYSYGDACLLTRNAA